MKLKIKQFEFSNVFAYGEGNEVDFSRDRVTLVVGDNGVGKSSIVNALEELLYNKNSRGIKKASVKNRNTTDPMTMRLSFELGDNIYELSKVTKASAKVSLSKNGEDISGHTATQTYKVLESEIGLDFQTFSKLVYQSTKSSLDFLSATDTNRKKFLIGLLGLEKYSAYEEAAKEALKAAKSKMDTVQGSLNVVIKTIERTKEIPDLILPVDVEVEDDDLVAAVPMLQMKVTNIDKTNKSIALAKTKLAKANTDVIDAEESLNTIIEYPEAEDFSEQISTASSRKTKLATKMASEKKLYQNFKSDAENTTCPTCNTVLDKSESQAAMNVAKGNWIELRDAYNEVEEELEGLKANQVDYTRYTKYVAASEKATERLDSAKAMLKSMEELHLENSQLEEESVENIQKEIATANSKIQATRKRIQEQNAHNLAAATSEATRNQLIEQHEEATGQLDELQAQLKEFSVEVGELDILTKAFGAKGLVAYKIESSIKQLENILNHYLSELTAGRFALGFELNGTKLDVVIYDDGLLVEVNSLSTGQFTNVQFATLLAIRTILSSLNSVDINLLYLDEGVSFLDAHSKDRLVDLLLKEDDLNTYIVSHGYNHPLTVTMDITAEDGVSTIRVGN
ncbi:SbcC-like subunit of palindrome specific endonucl ease [Vibrio phage D260]